MVETVQIEQKITALIDAGDYSAVVVLSKESKAEYSRRDGASLLTSSLRRMYIDGPDAFERLVYFIGSKRQPQVVSQGDIKAFMFGNGERVVVLFCRDSKGEGVAFSIAKSSRLRQEFSI
jgi:hypothetical protein